MYSSCEFRIYPLDIFSFRLYFCCKIYFSAWGPGLFQRQRHGRGRVFFVKQIGGDDILQKIGGGNILWVRRSFVSTRSPLMGGDTPTPCACGKIRCKKYTPAPLALPKYTPVTLSGFRVASACPASYPRCIAKYPRQSASWSAMPADSLASNARSPSVMVSDTCI